MTLVSVVVPVREDEHLLPRAVESLRAQRGADVEVVVVHSGDEAAFPERIRELDAVTYVRQPPGGVAAARNLGLDVAAGDVVGFCDADDWWHPAKLEAQLPALEAGADVVYADEYVVRTRGTYRNESLPVEDPERHHVAHFRNGGVGSRSVLARAACFERERFDERFEVREDAHLWTRLFRHFRPARVPRALSYKVVRPGTLSSDVDRAYRMERLEITDLVERFPELAAHRAHRERRLQYRYAKRLLSEEGRARDARRVLAALAADGHVDARVGLLAAIAALPAGHSRAVRGCQALKWRLQGLARTLGEVDAGPGTLRRRLDAVRRQLPAILR